MKVLFVCSGNTCRSPFAAAIARGEGVDAESAGTIAYEGAPAPGDAIAAAQEFGVALDLHRARPLTLDLIEHADLVVGMAPEHVATVEELGGSGKTRLLGEGVEDPIGRGPETYRRVYGEIAREVRALLGS